MCCCSENILFKDYKYFVFLFCCFILQISILLSITIYYYVSRNNYIWFNSKIAIINNILEDNYKNYKIYQFFEEYEHYSALNFSYYELLKNSTKDNCSENLKQCGILDTLGNKMCLYKDFPCPVNELIVDLVTNKSYYTKRGFQSIYYHLLRKVDDYNLYFKNTSYDKKIVSSLVYLESPPKLIDNHNFKFDFDAYEIKYGDLESSIKNNLTSYFNMTNFTNVFFGDQNLENSSDTQSLTKVFEGDEDEFDNWDENPDLKSKLVITTELKKYINASLLNKNNVEDKNYTKIFDKIYYKNFIGFDNAEDMDKFKNVEFTIYKNIFPDNIKLGLIITMEVFLFIFIIIYIRKLIEDIEDKDDVENICKKNEYYIISCGMSIYIFSFIFFFGFYIKSAIEIFKYNKFYELRNIKCDQIIIDFLNEFIKRYNIKKALVILLIIFLVISLILYIISIYFYVKKVIEEDNLQRIENEICSSNSGQNNINNGNEKNSEGTNSGNNIIINVKNNSNNNNDKKTNSERNIISNIKMEKNSNNLDNNSKNEIKNEESPININSNKNRLRNVFNKKTNINRGNTFNENNNILMFRQNINRVNSSRREMVNNKKINKTKTHINKKMPFKDNCLLV